MKRLFIFLIICFSWSCYGQVNFINKDWIELLKQAKTENKLIYLDAYTDWCGWCKVLDKETYSDSIVGAFMNSNFICTKLEMEKSEWGTKIARKYVVNSFPQGLIFTADGKLVYGITGYAPPKEYLENLKKAVNKENHWDLKGYSNSFDVVYPEIYTKAMGEKSGRKFPEKKEVNEYLSKQKDKFSESNWVVWKRFSFALDEERSMFVISNRKKFSQLYGRDAVEEIIQRYIQKRIDSAAKTKDEKLFQGTLKLLEESIQDGKKSRPWFEMHYYEQTKDWKKYAEIADEMIIQNPDLGAASINSYAWNLYEYCDDQVVLLKAVSWMENVVEKEPTYAYLDTFAALLYKTGQFSDAEKFALQAISTGKATNEKVEATEELLLKIRKK